MEYQANRALPFIAALVTALILGWGALDEGENQASDGRREGCGTASEKFYWRPVAPTSYIPLGKRVASPPQRARTTDRPAIH